MAGADHSVAPLRGALLLNAAESQIGPASRIGKGGLAICQSQRVECVISELTLPDMSGFEVLLQVIPNRNHPATAFIFLTRLTLSPMKHLALNNGAQGYVVKAHSSGDELDRTIRKALASVAPTRKDPRS